jgi:hypothetical protein
MNLKESQRILSTIFTITKEMQGCKVISKICVDTIIIITAQISLYS